MSALTEQPSSPTLSNENRVGQRNLEEAPNRLPTDKQSVLLGGPILPALIRLALPTVVVLLVQTSVGLAETYFVSRLGTSAVAGVALVFPILMLMQTMANGGMGGGVASSIARAIGAGRRQEADSLVLNALVIAVVVGLLFTVAELLIGQVLYKALGGRGEALSSSLEYADVLFYGAVLVWAVSLLAAALRGAGNTVVPAIIVFMSAFLVLPLSPALIFGWGPLPKLGVGGAGLAVVIYYFVALIVLARYLRSGRGALYLPLDLRLIKWRLLADILKVGAPSSIASTLQNLTAILVTGVVGNFGTDAIAGYGLASRLDYVLITLWFALGTGALTMVGINLGAGQVKRAERVAWVAALFAAGITEILGLAAAIFPDAWLGLFSTDPAVLATGATYFRIVAPSYGAFGFGLLMYFASQGAGRMRWPLIAVVARLIVAAFLGSLIVTEFGGDLPELFSAVAAGSVALAAIVGLMTRLKGWESRPPIANQQAGGGA